MGNTRKIYTESTATTYKCGSGTLRPTIFTS